MTTWTDIFPDVDGPPVKGEPGDFDAARHAFTRMGDDAQEVLDQFNRIQASGDIAQLRGQAATAFERFVGEVADSLGDLPRVSHEAGDVFGDHATRLDALHAEVDSALARARTNWERRQELERDVDAARTRTDRLQSQIDGMAADTDPTTSAQLQGDRDGAAAAFAVVRGELRQVDEALRAIRDEWSDLREREVDARRTTISQLDGIDLGDLKDPGRFRSFVEGACEVMMTLTPIDEIAEFVGAALRGDWAAVLWKLREVLDVLILVAVVVAVFASGGLLAFVLVAALALAVAKLAVDAALLSTKWPDPESGKVVNGVDIAMDVFDVVTAGRGAQLLRGGDAALSAVSRMRLAGQFRNADDLATRTDILRQLGVRYTATTRTSEGLILHRGELYAFRARSESLVVDGRSLDAFQRNLVRDGLGDGLGVVVQGYETAGALVDGGALSTDVFPSIRDGHSSNDSDATDVKIHIIPQAPELIPR
jgi:hypothetical protein